MINLETGIGSKLEDKSYIVKIRFCDCILTNMNQILLTSYLAETIQSSTDGKCDFDLDSKTNFAKNVVSPLFAVYTEVIK